VIRQRTRSDQEYPDLGQLISWDMRWQWTSILVEEEHGGADCHLTRTSQDGAELIIASLARRYWYGRHCKSPGSGPPTRSRPVRSDAAHPSPDQPPGMRRRAVVIVRS